MTLEAPELRTERLLLRGWREPDLAAFAAFQADERVARWVGGQRVLYARGR